MLLKRSINQDDAVTRPYTSTSFFASHQPRSYEGILAALRAASDRAPCALTVGNFDGVHRGHQALLTRVVAAARARDLTPAVMTFEPHPREFFAPERAPARVSNLRDKLAAFERCGIERTFVAHFNRRFSQLSPSAFIEDVLLAGCAVRWLLVGDDFRFGAQRAGDTALLADYAARGAFELEVMPTISHDGERISSTAVRASTGGRRLDARFDAARPRLHDQRPRAARTQAGPIAWLSYAQSEDRTLASGAAAGFLRSECTALPSGRSPASPASACGRRWSDAGRWLLEVHLFDFADAVYGRLVTVEFVQETAR